MSNAPTVDHWTLAFGNGPKAQFTEYYHKNYRTQRLRAYLRCRACNPDPILKTSWIPVIQRGTRYPLCPSCNRDLWLNQTDCDRSLGKQKVRADPRLPAEYDRFYDWDGTYWIPIANRTRKNWPEIEGIAPNGYRYGMGALNRVTAPQGQVPARCSQDQDPGGFPRCNPPESNTTNFPVRGQDPPGQDPQESYKTVSPVPPYQSPAGGQKRRQEYSLQAQAPPTQRQRQHAYTVEQYIPTGDDRNDDLYDNGAPSGYSSFPAAAPVPPSPAYQHQRGHTQTNAIQQNYPGLNAPAYDVCRTPRQPQNYPNPAPPHFQSYTNTLPRPQSQVPPQSINRTGMNIRDILNQNTAIPVESLLRRDTPAPRSPNSQSANQAAPGSGHGQSPSRSQTSTALERNAPGSRALRSPGARDPAQNEGNPFAQPVFVPEKTFGRSALTFSQLTAQVADMAISNGPGKEGASSKAGESKRLDVRSKGTSSKADSTAANAAKEKGKGNNKHGKKK